MATQTITAPIEARAITKNAYIYGFPLVDGYRIQYSYFVDRNSKEYKGDWNQIHHPQRILRRADNAMHTLNSDVCFSFLGADLRTDPLVLTFPAVEKDRYFSAQFIDLYTFNFAYVGSRTTGNDRRTVLLAGPTWRGEAPRGVQSIIKAETEFASVLYRTQLFGPGDIEDVRKIQEGYGVQTLSRFLGRTPPAPPPKIDFLAPFNAADERTSLEFFRLMNFVLKFCAVHPSDREIMGHFARLGIGADSNFETQALSPEVRHAMLSGMTDAWRAYEVCEKQMAVGDRTGSDLYGTRSLLKGNYLLRMVAAINGIYGDSKEEAHELKYFVDANGKNLDGSTKCYILRFGPGQLPPVNAFWSLTPSELSSKPLTGNSSPCGSVNSSMLPEFRRDPDGGLTIYIQHRSPGQDSETNWLRVSNSPFLLTLRLYWPQPEALNGFWRKPRVQCRD